MPLPIEVQLPYPCNSLMNSQLKKKYTSRIITAALAIVLVVGAFKVMAALPSSARARFPAIDIHSHLGGVETWGAGPRRASLVPELNE